MVAVASCARGNAGVHGRAGCFHEHPDRARQAGVHWAAGDGTTPAAIRNARRHPCRLGLEFPIRSTKGPATMRTMQIAIITAALATSAALVQAQEPKIQILPQSQSQESKR